MKCWRSIQIDPSTLQVFDFTVFRIHVCDHKLRELPIGDRTLGAHFGDFVISQAKKGEAEARRLALDIRYGSECTEALIAGCPARVYELGPEPEPDDIDGRSPSVVTWHDAGMIYLIASDRMFVAELVQSLIRSTSPDSAVRALLGVVTDARLCEGTTEIRTPRSAHREASKTVHRTETNREPADESFQDSHVLFSGSANCRRPEHFRWVGAQLPGSA